MNLLIVGGGFAGVAAALNAAGEREAIAADVGITLVSRDPWLCIRPRLYEAGPENLRAPLPPVLEAVGVNFIQAEVDAIDGGARRIFTATGAVLPYDRLILASGSVLHRPPIPGAELAHDIDAWEGAMRFDRRLAELCATDAAPVVAIVGAGMCGIELACELRARITAHGGVEAGRRARILLFERAAVLGQDFGEEPRPVIEEALARAGVEVQAGVVVACIDEDGVTLADGRRFAAGTTVLATGMRASGLARLPGAQQDALGRLRVDDWLRVTGVAGVFAAGDVAHALVEPGRAALMSCQHARTMGKFAGGNALRDLLGLPLRVYRQRDYSTCLDLGDHGAVHTLGWERRVKAIGQDAKRRKQWINRELIPPPPPGSSRETILAFGRIDPVTGR